jgi:hypothetical protein
MNFLKTLFTAFILLLSHTAWAENWSVTQLHTNFGDALNPFTGESSFTRTYTLEHASEHGLGDNYFFIDFLNDSYTDGFQDTGIYGEWYTTLSLTKAFNTRWSYGHIKDTGLVFGINAGEEGLMKYTPGIKLSWDAPGFDFLTTTFAGYIDANGGIQKEQLAKQDNSIFVDLAWGAPFSLAKQAFYFTGHVEYISGRNDEQGNKVNEWLLAQPAIYWDVGQNFELDAKQLMVGIEWRYWYNKLGTDDIENQPFLHAVWVF